jgi:hypothetical protein
MVGIFLYEGPIISRCLFRIRKCLNMVASIPAWKPKTVGVLSRLHRRQMAWGDVCQTRVRYGVVFTTGLLAGRILYNRNINNLVLEF